MTLKGKWRIVEMALWDLDFLDMMEPAYIFSTTKPGASSPSAASPAKSTAARPRLHLYRPTLADFFNSLLVGVRAGQSGLCHYRRLAAQQMRCRRDNGRGCHEPRQQDEREADLARVRPLTARRIWLVSVNHRPLSLPQTV